MNEEPVEIDIILRQNVDDEADKATRGIDKMAEASEEAQQKVRDTLTMQQLAIKKLREELEPLKKQIADLSANAAPGDKARFEGLTKGVDDLEARLLKASQSLGKMNVDADGLSVRIKNLEERIRSLANEIARLNQAGETEALQSYIDAHTELLASLEKINGDGSLGEIVSMLEDLSGQLQEAGDGAESFADSGDLLSGSMGTLGKMLAIARGALGINNQVLTQSINAVNALSRSQGLLTTATNFLTKSLRVSDAVAKGLVATLGGVFTMGIGAAIYLIQKFIEKQRAAREEQNKLNQSIADNAGEQIANYEKLRVSYNKLGNDIKAKEKFIKDNQDAFTQLGVSINNVNDADNALIKNTEAFRQAIMARAQATAAMEIATEKYKEGLRKQMQAQERWSNPTKTQAIEDAVNSFGKTGSAQKRWIERDGRYVYMNAAAADAGDKLWDENEKLFKEGDKLINQSVNFANSANATLAANGIKLAETGAKNQKNITDKQAKEPEKAANRLAKLSADIQKETDAAIVAAMQEGRDKKLAELKAEYDAKVALIAERQKEIEELEKTAGVDGSKQKRQLNALSDAEKAKYGAAVKAVNDGSAAAMDAIWQEINARFQTESQNRLSEINRFYQEQIAKARKNGATQLEIDMISADHKRDIELEKKHIALETLDFEAQIAIKKAQIEDRRVLLQTDREEKILRVRINAAQKRLQKLREIQSQGGDTGKEIEAVTAEIEAMNAELDRMPTRKFQEIAEYAQQILDGIGNFVGSFDEDLGGLFDIASGAVGGIAGLASGNPKEMVAGAMQLLDVVGKVIKANKQANEEVRKFNLSLAQQAIDYSLAVIRSIKDIKSETDNIFTTNYTNTLTQGMAGYNAAIDKQAELMRKLGAATVKTGVEKKKFLGITYGTRDVFGSLLKQYPELIKKDGTLNRELAESLKKSGNLKEETADLIDNILQASDAANEAMQAVESELQNLVGSIGSELKNALDDAFASGTDSAKAMTDSVVKMLKDLSTQKLFNAVFGGIFSQLENRMKDSFGDSGDRDLSDDINWFMREYSQYVGEYNKGLEQLREAIKTQYGTDPFATDDGRKAVNKGIAQASQDSIDELNGRLTFLVMKVSDIGTISAAQVDIEREQLLMQRAMAGYLETIAENSEFLQRLKGIDENIDRLIREGTYIKK